eukprot:TRINITY_DN3670_c0_g1_i7.p2 TRINITY_DN3670_c0_g1~~TRINITY_DN3670_c0_g1_i7.p2  ORF type:complete len:249 (-),score=50.87 TRINITY_DN3670_c0_g1_i7:440-1186(-)
MCGHGTIGAVTIAIETGRVKPVEPITTVVLDTPASLVTAYARVHGGRVLDVSVLNVPAFVLHRDVAISIAGYPAPITVDVAFGGSFFAIVDARRLGLEVTPSNAPKFLALSPAIRDAVNAQLEIQHPTLPHITTVDLCEFFDNPTHPDATFKNIVVFGDGQYDRSPCGTGTCAKLALMHARGEIQIGDEFVYESVIGTLFKGQVVEEMVLAGGVKAIRPQITGSAYITGFSDMMIDQDDPLKDGFLIR